METGKLTEAAVLPAPPPLTLSFQPIFPYNDKLPTTLDVPSFTVIPPLDERQIHPQEILDEVNVVFDEWLKTVNIPQAKKTKQREKGDYVIISNIFIFDEEIDPGGDLTADDAGTRRICDQTLQCIDACLHPDPCLAASFTTTPPPNSPGTVEMLYEILSVMRADMGPSTVEHLRRQLHEYVEGVARQQAVRQYDRLPDPWHHLELRCDDIGVRPSVTQIEYAMGLELPDRVVLGCAQLCVLVNEILSLEKEFRAGQLENLCLLFVNAESITIHAAISKVKALIRKRYRSCEDAIARLPWSDDEQVNDNIRQYVQCCQRIATGTAQWSYMCTRYFQRAQLSNKWYMTPTLRQ
ncbi:terpene synthase [Apiospora arundinis]|uniref:Terpene synthase n=1 Tax=Apiospora arundinis TaxID=335852 RepID=A0ABR2I9K7_9PEZI